MAEPFKMPKFSIQDPRLWHYRCLVMRIIDGDTVMLLRDKGTYQYDVLKVRLAGVDAPEKRPRVGNQEQREAERKLAEAASRRLEELIGQREVIIKTEKTGKFGRYLSHIYVPDDKLGRTANEILLEEGLAVRYGDPRPWREDEMRRAQQNRLEG